MTYYLKIARDKAREKHLEEIDKIEQEMSCLVFNQSDKWFELDKKLKLYRKQLKLYDEIMGYKKEL